MHENQNLFIMKKVLVILALSLMAFTAKAQVYVGGTLSFSGVKEQAVFSVAPEAGYNFNDNMAAGASLGLSFTEGMTSFVIDPYFRYYFAELGPVRFFGDGHFNFTNVSVRDAEGRSATPQSSTMAGDSSSRTWKTPKIPNLTIPAGKR